MSIPRGRGRATIDRLTHRLPMGVRVIGWFIAVAMGWNLLFLPLFLVVLPNEEIEKEAPELLRPEAWFFLGPALLVALWMFVSAVRMLRRREAGRKGTVVSIWTYLALAAVAAVWTVAVRADQPLSFLEDFFLPIAGLIIPCLLVWLVTSYLNRPEIKAKFKEDTPESGKGPS